MKAYVDSSVMLRVVLQEPNALMEWPQITRGITSTLMRVECCRSLDRLVRDGNITDDQYTLKLSEVDRILATMAVLRISSDVLSAASRRLGIRVDTLDAIHLATAERYRRTHVAEAAPMFATHDRTLAAAARHVGFEVIGSPLESPA